MYDPFINLVTVEDYTEIPNGITSQWPTNGSTTTSPVSFSFYYYNNSSLWDTAGFQLQPYAGIGVVDNTSTYATATVGASLYTKSYNLDSGAYLWRPFLLNSVTGSTTYGSYGSFYVGSISSTTWRSAISSTSLMQGLDNITEKGGALGEFGTIPSLVTGKVPFDYLMDLPNLVQSFSRGVYSATSSSYVWNYNYGQASTSLNFDFTLSTITSSTEYLTLKSLRTYLVYFVYLLFGISILGIVRFALK